LECRAASDGENAYAVLFGAPLHSTHTPTGFEEFYFLIEEEEEKKEKKRLRKQGHRSGVSARID